ncbi:metallophosphoesterase family protein [Calycomorphotria hydatis]|uniref:Phosphoesterase n=1 Tax=Calycomorphotria hydatis TaxID=2528027 RepID=A0A517TB21_9PLAN|nr:YfcE family phosphodiesterase [Calycomorphotria hydatis]QDT65567.1 phosphodiesterase [Calycomorphotria hydatis]
MKILLLADIHSNWPALAAIQESFDACLFAGDLVDYGPHPTECINWAMKHVTAGIRGNHDHAVAQRIAGKGKGTYRAWSSEIRPLQWKSLNGRQMKYLARLPLTKHLHLGDQSFYLVHGTPRDPLDEYLGAQPEVWENRLEGIDADFVVVGHTHIPFAIEVGKTTVINPGSVGQPRDGNPHAAYAIIENGRVEFRRVEYDVNQTIQAIEQLSLSTDVLELARGVLTTGGRADFLE